MLALFAAVLCAVAAPQNPDGSTGELRLQNGVVWTGTGDLHRGDLGAMYGKIGRTDDTSTVRVIDLKGAFVVPGLQDAHGHLLGLGSSLVEVNLVDTGSFAEVVARTAAAAAKQPKGTWVVGRGWDQNDWQKDGQAEALPRHASLSAAIPDHPVWLVRVDGHAGLLNAAGLRAAGITKDSKSPTGGEILFDDQGEPTGVLVDAAMAAVPEPVLTDEQVRERLLLAQAECLRHGLTCVHDAGVGKRVLDVMVALDKEGRWKLRTYVMLDPNERELIERGVWQTMDGRIVVRAVKCYADGALGSRGARLLAGYADRPEYLGLVSMPKGMLLELAQRCADHGMQLCTHAIGDAANRTVLDAYSLVKSEPKLSTLRFRIEHAQIVDDADVGRFGSLGVLPSMQPTHLTSDMPWAPVRLGPERVLRAYAWRRFLDRGVMVPFGSDFPVESVDPRKGLFAAVTTRGMVDGQSRVLRPDQRLSREEALRGFTRHAAYAMFAEQQLGTIEDGKRADFTVFDRNLLTCSDDELLTAKVLLTVIDGRVVHDGRGQ